LAGKYSKVLFFIELTHFAPFKFFPFFPFSTSILSFNSTSPPTMAAQNGSSNDFTVKAGLAQMLKGGVIMDVVNAEQVRS